MTMNNSENGFVKMNRTPDVLEVIKAAPLAFVLASVIALRARYRPGTGAKGIQPGEAWLGDYRLYGMSEQQYRTAKKQLAEWGFASFKATKAGTVGKLIDTRLFDVLNFPSNEQPTDKPRTANGQPTTNKKETKEESKEGKEAIVGSYVADVCATTTKTNNVQSFTPPTDDEFWQFVADEKLSADLADTFFHSQWEKVKRSNADWQKALVEFSASKQLV